MEFHFIPLLIPSLPVSAMAVVSGKFYEVRSKIKFVLKSNYLRKPPFKSKKIPVNNMT